MQSNNQSSFFKTSEQSGVSEIPLNEQGSQSDQLPAAPSNLEALLEALNELEGQGGSNAIQPQAAINGDGPTSHNGSFLTFFNGPLDNGNPSVGISLPAAGFPINISAIPSMVADPGDSSFPSGHTAHNFYRSTNDTSNPANILGSLEGDSLEGNILEENSNILNSTTSFT